MGGYKGVRYGREGGSGTNRKGWRTGPPLPMFTMFHKYDSS